ncbi:MAG: flagellar FlbD family protein [Nocardioides sp.]
MITLTRLSGSVFCLNSDLIERLDSTPDTVITLLDGSKYVVAESMPAVISIIRRHRAEVLALSGLLEAMSAAGEEWAGRPGQPGYPGMEIEVEQVDPPPRQPNLLIVNPGGGHATPRRGAHS